MLAPHRDVFMSLRSLHHLELQLDNFSPPDIHWPRVLPTLRYLCIHGDPTVDIVRAIHSIRLNLSLPFRFIRAFDPS
ncbi:hypothetical protein FIBSPDRAFT_852664 [Athelia psychrophila]|uniref:Uncharacterized protein n=1 Tax=Athelia psychrophila TaxID=1759441 RepID=A0A166RQ22_9AGAM|nr:hypothetical protein FIBSPDRAFT_852664 [Fibularhizoctonia sp. CBS 109695]